MDLYDEITRKLGQVNAVQIVGVCSVVWTGSYWEKASGTMPVGQAEKGFTSSNMIQYLMKVPHETSKRGTMLVITPIRFKEDIG